MPKLSKIAYLIAFALLILLSSCASSNKNPYNQKKKKSSHVNTTQLGRNRYYFSPDYQKRLQKSVKKKKSKY